MSDPCAIVELRQYTLRPGRRATLVALFEREFLETQEALGMTIPGEFVDIDDPDRIVWLRGFSDMSARRAGLEAFYGGPVWKAHRDAANATMIDSDDVLLLRPARPGAGFTMLPERETGGDGGAGRLYVANIALFREPVEGTFLAPFDEMIAPVIARSGGTVVGAFVTDGSANDFPALPVREGENAFVWIARFDAVPQYEAFVGALDASPARAHLTALLEDALVQPPVVRRLSPAPRSRLR
jgi:NIPSNAP protein